MTDKESIEIIDNMYQKRMSQIEETTNEGLIIHLGTKVEFTKEEEASVILLRQLQKSKREIEKKDKIIDLMATYIGKVDISEDLCNDDICDEGNNCNKCVKEYFLNEVEKEK